MGELIRAIPSQLFFALLGAVAISVLRWLALITTKWLRASRRKRRNERFSADFNCTNFSLGGLTSSVFVSDFNPGGYSADLITCQIDSEDPVGIPSAGFNEAVQKWTSAVDRGEIFNGESFALSRFRHRRDAAFEQPGLALQLRPSDYVRQRALADVFRSLGPDEYHREADQVRETPGTAGRFSATFGVPVVVISADEQLMWLKRSEASAVNAGKYTCTTAEGMNRDDLRSGVPDPYLCAARGLHEEIGLRLSANEFGQIRFIALLLDLDWWEWTLVGVLRLSDLPDHTLDSRTLKQYFASARPRDKWETSEPAFCPFTPHGVAEFIDTHPVTNYAAVGAALALMSETSFRREAVVNAFGQVT